MASPIDVLQHGILEVKKVFDKDIDIHEAWVDFLFCVNFELLQIVIESLSVSQITKRKTLKLIGLNHFS